MTLTDQHGNSVYKIAFLTAGVGFAFDAFTGSVATFSLWNNDAPSCPTAYVGAGNSSTSAAHCAEQLSALNGNYSILADRWANCTEDLRQNESVLEQIRNITS